MTELEKQVINFLLQGETLSDGTTRFTYKVPATNIPGSFAEYIKEVNSAGETVKVYKTTYAPDSSIVHIKDKL